MSSNFSEVIGESAKKSVILFISQVISTIIIAATTIWVARVLGPTNYGVYTIAVLPVSVAMLVQDLGVNTALIRFCAKYRYEKRDNELKSLVLTGLFFSIMTSIVLSGVLYFYSNFIATNLLNRPDADILLKASALSVLGNGGLLTTIQAIMVGYEMMRLRGITQILYSILRGAFSAILIIAGLNTFGVAISTTLALLISGFTATFLLFYYIRFGREDKGISWDTLKTLLRFGFPLSVSTLIGSGLSQIYTSLIVIYASADMIGNYSAASNFGVLIQFFTIPISMSLFPLFSKFKYDDPRLKTIYKLSVKYTTLIILPVVFLLLLLSAQISRIIFGTGYQYASLYLSLYMITFAFEGLGGISLNNLISGIGELGIVLRTSIIGLISGSLIGFILIPRYQIIGLLLTLIIAPRVNWVYQIISLKKKIGLTIDWSSMTRIYVVAITALISSYLILYVFKFQGWVAIITGSLIYSITYILGLFISKALIKNDIDQLLTITSSIGPLAYILKLISSLLRN